MAKKRRALVQRGVGVLHEMHVVRHRRVELDQDDARAMARERAPDVPVVAVDVDRDEVGFGRGAVPGEDRVERRLALPADEAVERAHPVIGVRLLDLARLLGVALDQEAAPAAIGDEVPCVAEPAPVPGAELDAVATARPDDVEDLRQDAVLADLRGHVRAVVEQPGAVGAQARHGPEADLGHGVVRRGGRRAGAASSRVRAARSSGPARA